MLDTQWAQQWMALAAQYVAADREELNGLDRAIGDGDHGENLSRGFAAVVDKLDDQAHPGDVLKMAAMTLMSVVGGAAGPLYGTAFLRMATAFGAQEDVSLSTFAQALTDARDGLVARGKAAVGDKTMVDVWTPAVDAADEAASNDLDELSALDAVAQAAEDAAERTVALEARKGRASYLGERSVGHKDPGSASSVLIFRAARDAAKDEE